MTGAVINPINVMLTPDEVAYVTQDCGARAIIASGDKQQGLLDVQADTPLEDIVIFGGDGGTGVTAFEDILASASTSFDVAPGDPMAMATISYTSGTTGRPKGAMSRHRALIINTALTSIMHGRNSHDVFCTGLPVAHAYGVIIQLASLMYGAKLVLLPRFEEVAAFEAIQNHRATMFDGVPTTFMMMLAHPDFEKYDLTSIEKMSVGGQTMPAAKGAETEERFNAPCLELWGMTELAGLGTTHALYADNKIGSMGVAMPYFDLRIADPEDSSVTLPEGDVGELVVRGPSVMMGYFNNEEATRETVVDGWLRTGDLARVDGDGYYFMVDRKKDMILTAGYNVYPAEIERVLAGHPAVAMNAVGRIPDDVKGEIPKAYIVLRPGASATEEEVVKYCRDHLAAYKVPRAIQFVDALPTTSSGKVMRRELTTLDG
jgi:long-chain acyl-CoA synthetase